MKKKLSVAKTTRNIGKRTGKAAAAQAAIDLGIEIYENRSQISDFIEQIFTDHDSVRKEAETVHASVNDFATIDVDHEDTNLPLAIIYGTFTPFGSSDTTDNPADEYSRAADALLSTIMLASDMTSVNYSYTLADWRAYFDICSRMIELQLFIGQLLAISSPQLQNTSAPLTGFVTTAVSGQVIIVQRRLTALIERMGFPQHWIDILHAGFHISTVSEDPYSGIRMYAPLKLKPVEGNSLTAEKIIILALELMDEFHASQSTRRIAQIVSLGPVKLPTYSFTSVPHVPAAINNLLNMPYWNSVTDLSNPGVNSDQIMPVFYYNKITPLSLLTAHSTSQTGIPTFGIWKPYTANGDNTDIVYYVNNTGDQFGVSASNALFSASGLVWEVSATLEAGNNPFISKMDTTSQGVAQLMAEVMLLPVKVPIPARLSLKSQGSN